MCHPPLACPLCSSAGGFPSPGALWLGLIGVANRLLSCPVCHELLLGLDKLTIHLVSHVPDLNLLASAIGNCVNSNQKVIQEFGASEPCVKRLQKSNFAFTEDVSIRNRYISPKTNCQSHERPDKYDPANNSDSKTYIPSGTARSNKTERELDRVKASGLGDIQDIYKQSAQNILDQKTPIYYPTCMSDAYTQTMKALELQKAAEGNANIKVTKKGISKLNAKFYPLESEVNVSTNRFGSYFHVSQQSDSDVSENLPDNADKLTLQAKSNTSPSTPIIESHHKALKRSNLVLVPGQMYCSQATKNTLQQDSDRTLTSGEYLERLRNTMENETSKSDSGKIKYQCGPCNTTFEDHKCLSLHHVMVHPNADVLKLPAVEAIASEPIMNYPCQLCSRKLISKGALLVHMRFAHSVDPGISLEAIFEKQNDGSMPIPKEKINKIVDASDSQSKCADNLVSKSNSLRNHQIDINFHEGTEEKSPSSTKEEKEIKVYLDERQMNSKDSSEIIDNDSSQDINKEECSNASSPQQYSLDEEMKHSCKICEAQFSSIIELIAHRPAHNEDDGCICVVCGKAFKKEQHLQQHLRTHEGKQWECDVCSKFFTTKYFLKKHKRLHTGEMPYSCETCGKTFTFQQSYHKHLLYHSDEKPHACGECGKRFKELSTLHNHERIHTGEKPFTCESCGKAFRQRVSYLVHRRIHTGVMPYKCTACEKSFRYKVSQRTHKCSSQQTGTVVRQSSDLVERLLSHQRDKPSVSDCSSVGEVFFAVGVTESLSNQDQCTSQHSNEILQELPKFSPTQNVINTQKSDTYPMVSASVHTFSGNVPTIESQNVTNPFSMPKISVIAQEQIMTKKSSLNSCATIYQDDTTRKDSSDYCSAMSHKGNESKNTESQSGKIEQSQLKVNEFQLSSEHGSDSSRPNFLIQSELTCENHQDSGLNQKEPHCKINETGDLFSQTLFPSTNHIRDSPETDFFTMVMSPAEPALEQMGKLTISSLPNPEKVSIAFSCHNDKQFGGAAEISNSQTHPTSSPSMEIRENLEHLEKSSKTVISQVDNPPSPREQESTANAADLSSFLQSCFDQWNSSNIISNEKTKALPRQDQMHQLVKHEHDLSHTEDNRLHTINEESLKKLLYGDNTA